MRFAPNQVNLIKGDRHWGVLGGMLPLGGAGCGAGLA